MSPAKEESPGTGKKTQNPLKKSWVGNERRMLTWLREVKLGADYLPVCWWPTQDDHNMIRVHTEKQTPEFSRENRRESHTMPKLLPGGKSHHTLPGLDRAHLHIALVPASRLNTSC